MKATFSTQTDIAVLYSPPLASSSKSLCLLFKYQISSPKIVLNLYTSTVTEAANFSLTKTIQYANQDTVGMWNIGLVTLPANVHRFRLEAFKTSVTTDVQFVILDDVEIKNCSDGEPYFNLCTYNVL